jgi:hypothetical protein
VRQDLNRNREACVLTEDGFTLPGGGIFQFGESYIPAQFNTARAHSLRGKGSRLLESGLNRMPLPDFVALLKKGCAGQFPLAQ